MMERNPESEITLSRCEAMQILKEVELILISLHKMGSYYSEEMYREEYERETTRFIDECKVTHRLAKIRYIMSVKFDDALGEDDMDDIEREMEKLKYWDKPGDNIEEFNEDYLE